MIMNQEPRSGGGERGVQVLGTGTCSCWTVGTARGPAGVLTHLVTMTSAAAALEAFQINWSSLLCCAGLGGLWIIMDSKNDSSMVIAASAVLYVVIGRVMEQGLDWVSVFGVCSVGLYFFQEWFLRPPGKLEPTGTWTTSTADLSDATVVAETRSSFANACLSKRLYRTTDEGPRVIGFATLEPDAGFDSCARVLEHFELFRIVTRRAYAHCSPAVLCALSSEFQVAFMLRDARYIIVHGTTPGAVQILCCVVATDGSGTDAPTYVAGFLTEPQYDEAVAAKKTRWAYSCTPLEGRDESLDEGAFQAWWRGESARTLLATRFDA